MEEKFRTEKRIVKAAGKLKEIVTVKDGRGKILQRIMNPVMVKFYPRDVMQVIVGASILAIPVSFTEEVWNLGAQLPLTNILALLMLSILFIASFVYYNYYRKRMKEHHAEFIKRVSATYIVSFIVVALLLTIIEKAPWHSEPLLALARTVIVAFPSSMSAAVADMIK